jgi:hypothetical protein
MEGILEMDWKKQVPRTVDLKILPMSECKNAKWLSDRLAKIVTPRRDINETFMICAGLFQKDVKNQWIGPNKGDSGGIHLWKHTFHIHIKIILFYEVNC